MTYYDSGYEGSSPLKYLSRAQNTLERLLGLVRLGVSGYYAKLLLTFSLS